MARLIDCQVSSELPSPEPSPEPSFEPPAPGAPGSARQVGTAPGLAERVQEFEQLRAERRRSRPSSPDERPVQQSPGYDGYQPAEDDQYINPEDYRLFG